MATTPEGRVKAKISAWLKAQGAWYFCPVSNGMGVHGVPDFVACIGGRFVGIEAKAPGKRGNTSPLQDRQIAGIHAAGGIALVVDDVNQLEKIHELLRVPNQSHPVG